MYGVIVVDADMGGSTWLGRDAYICDHCLGYRHDYLLLFSDLLNQKYKDTLVQFLVIYFISRSRGIYLSTLLQFYLSFLAVRD